MNDIQYSFKSIIISILFSGTIGGIIIFLPQLLWGRVIISQLLEDSGYNPIKHVPNLIPLLIGCLLFSYLMMIVLSIFTLLIFDRLASFKVGCIMGATCFYIFCVATNARIAVVLPNTLPSYLEHAFIFWWFGSMIMSTTGVYLLSQALSGFARVFGIFLMLLPIIIGGTSQGTKIPPTSNMLTYYLILWIPLFVFWIVSGSLWGMMLKYLRHTTMNKYQQ